MHPKMIIALANESQRSRQSERHQLQLRWPAVANDRPGLTGSYAAGASARRLLAGIRLRPRLS